MKKVDHKNGSITIFLQDSMSSADQSENVDSCTLSQCHDSDADRGLRDRLRNCCQRPPVQEGPASSLERVQESAGESCDW